MSLTKAEAKEISVIVAGAVAQAMAQVVAGQRHIQAVAVTKTQAKDNKVEAGWVKHNGFLVRADCLQSTQPTQVSKKQPAKSNRDADIEAEIERKNDVIGREKYNGKYSQKGKVVYLGVGQKDFSLPFIWHNDKLVYCRLPNLQ